MKDYFSIIIITIISLLSGFFVIVTGASIGIPILIELEISTFLIFIYALGTMSCGILVTLLGFIVFEN